MAYAYGYADDFRFKRAYAIMRKKVKNSYKVKPIN